MMATGLFAAFALLPCLLVLCILQIAKCLLRTARLVSAVGYMQIQLLQFDALASSFKIQ